MLDTLSDILDWLGAGPWEAVGIGAAIIAAFVGSLHFGTVMLIARHRRMRRQRLGEFLHEGQALLRQCSNEQEPAPQQEADSWARRVEAYLEKHLGGDYIASFRDGAGLPMGVTAIMSVAHRNLEGGIKIRLARLQQFLEELRQ